MQSTAHRVACFYFFVWVFLAGNAFAQKAVITTAAGDGTGGFAGDGGAATAAQLNGPAGIAMDAAGNIYIADRENHRVRKVAAATGVITTVAGNGIPGSLGDNGPATSAELNHPSGVAVDAAGNLYIADFLNNRVRKVTAATGIISTVEVYQFIPKSSLPGANDPFWKDLERRLGVKTFKDGFGLPVSLTGPVGIEVDSAENLYVAEQPGQRIRKFAAETGIVTTIAGTGVAGFSGDSGPATAARIHNPAQLALDAAGNIYFSDASNNRIRKVTAATGVISTVAGSGSGGFSGDGGAAMSAQLNSPGGVDVDAAGNLLIADTFNKRIRQVSAGTGLIRTVAGGGQSGDWCEAATSSLEPSLSVVVSASGNLIYIAEYSGHRVRLVTLGANGRPPALTTMAPPSGAAGTTQTINLNGTGFFGGTGGMPTSACRGTTVRIGGGGITIADVNAASDTSLNATLTIARDAALGARDVMVVTENGTSLPLQFTVTAAPPTLMSISPPNGVRGSTATLTLTGTNFDPQESKVVPDGEGLSISEVRVIDANSLTATFTVTRQAALGLHNVTVVTPAGSSNAVPFRAEPEGPSFVYGLPKMLTPTQHAPIHVSLTNPQADAVTATLKLTFTPNAATAADDPNVMFINSQSSGRTAVVTFPANATTALLSLPSGVLQAGTVAGTIQLTMTEVQVGGMDVIPAGTEFAVEVPRLVPIITNLRVLNRTPSGFDVEVTGYSTSREISAATFNFGASSGANLLTVQLQPNVISTFTTYYQSGTSTVAGGAFVYLQPFVIKQGDVNAVASVTVTLAAYSGESRQRFRLKASTDSDGKQTAVGAQRRWSEHHFRSGWLRSNRNNGFVKI